jgi:hypothetical protein
MDLLNIYLIFLHEREWNEPDNFKKFLRSDRFKNMIKNIETAKDNDTRQEIQPTQVGLIMTSGGDYKGREDLANIKLKRYTGLKKLNKYLPKGWEDKVRKTLDVEDV